MPPQKPLIQLAIAVLRCPKKCLNRFWTGGCLNPDTPYFWDYFKKTSTTVCKIEVTELFFRLQASKVLENKTGVQYG